MKSSERYVLCFLVAGKPSIHKYDPIINKSTVGLAVPTKNGFGIQKYDHTSHHIAPPSFSQAALRTNIDRIEGNNSVTIAQR